VRYLGGGTFMVQSGSRRSVEHVVDADPYDAGEAAAVEEWRCSCEWGTQGDWCPPGTGRMCSHVRAARAWVDRVLAARQAAAQAGRACTAEVK
jgi:hypothetical protein